MQKKKVKTINSKWLAFSILNELFFRKDVKSSDYEVFTIVLRKIIDTNSKRVIISQNDFISSSRTVRRVVPYLKGIDVIDFENTFISKDSTKQGFNRYWINEKFLEDDEYIYKINWSKLKWYIKQLDVFIFTGSVINYLELIYKARSLGELSPAIAGRQGAYGVMETKINRRTIWKKKIIS